MAFDDSNIEGQVGEQMYIDYLKDNNINFIDVREDELCQWLDIDFIIPQGNHTKKDILDNIRNGNPNKRTQRQKEIGYTVEVKLDKVTHNRYINKNGMISNGTGNLIYELISHNMPGCLARSYADFILYICVDTFDEQTVLSKAYMINLYKWRQAMVDSIDNTQNIKLKSLKYLMVKGIKTEENILNILHPVYNLMSTKGIVVDITEKIKTFFPKNLHMSK